MQGLDYNVAYVNPYRPVRWLREVSASGAVPVLHDKGQWIADTNSISAYLDKEYMQPCLASRPSPAVGLALLPYLRAYLTSVGPFASGAEVEVRHQLHELEYKLVTAGPFLSGTQMGSFDALVVRATSLYAHLEMVFVHNGSQATKTQDCAAFLPVCMRSDRVATLAIATAYLHSSWC